MLDEAVGILELIVRGHSLRILGRPDHVVARVFDENSEDIARESLPPASHPPRCDGRRRAGSVVETHLEWVRRSVCVITSPSSVITGTGALARGSRPVCPCSAPRSVPGPSWRCGGVACQRRCAEVGMDFVAVGTHLTCRRTVVACGFSRPCRGSRLTDLSISPNRFRSIGHIGARHGASGSAWLASSVPQYRAWLKYP